MQRHVRRFLALMMAALLALSALTVAVADDWRDLLRDLYGLTDDYEVEEQTEVYDDDEEQTEVELELPVTDPQQIVNYLSIYGELPENFITKNEAKALGWDSSFGPVQGRVIEVEGSVSVVSDPYAELCLKVDGVDEVLSALDVNAVVLEADDGTRTGLKHLENIWMKTLFGMNSGAEAYEMLRGKNLARVDIYTLDAVYVVSAGDGVRIE